MVDAVRIFVGAAANNEDLESQAVLEWSVRKHTQRDVEIIWMQQSNDQASPFFVGAGGWQTQAWATPFSGFRWAVPELAGFTGKAIYTDSDVIFMDDVGKLFDQQHPAGSILLGRGGGEWRICVSLWDCAAARDHLPPLAMQRANPSTHQRLSDQMRQAGLIAPFAGGWNCLDRELVGKQLGDPSISAIHYTDMRAQPQLRHAIPRLQSEGQRHWFDGRIDLHKFPPINALFDELLAEAKANGYGPERYRKQPFGEYKKRRFG